MNLFKQLARKRRISRARRDSNKNAIVHLFAVTKPPAKDPITITATYKQALEVISRCYYFDNIEHFNAWAVCHNKTPNFFSNSWREYLATVLNPATGAPNEHYVIHMIPYSADDLSALIRMAADYSPLFLPHEHTQEFECYVDKHMSYGPTPTLTLPEKVALAMHTDSRVETAISLGTFAIKHRHIRKDSSSSPAVAVEHVDHSAPTNNSVEDRDPDQITFYDSDFNITDGEPQ